ncbi:MAG TPA: type II secretion system F family protein [Candidatus Paceibacterota bacterium]|nr:type II secretion system F family protein [Candidatus Paceibacterota bacterium]
MPIYSYKAIKKGGTDAIGSIEAPSKDGAVALLLQRNLTPIEIKEMNEAISGFRRFSERAPTSADILFFIRNFGIALQAGVTVLNALALLAKDNKHSGMRDMIAGVEASVRGGATLSVAFTPYKEYFNPAFIGLLRSGEISGTLGKTLALISEYLKRDFGLRQRVRAALVYPLILVVGSLLVVLLLMVFVLPRLSGAFTQSGVTLPILTRIVLAISNLFAYSIWLDGIILLLITAVIVWFRKSPSGKSVFAQILERTPVARTVVHGVALVRFTRTLGNLLIAGIPMMEALETTAGSVGHLAMQRATLTTRTAVMGGAPLSVELEKYPELFPNIVVGLTRVGEETGKLGDILVEVSEFYDDEVDYLLRNMTTLLEPILLLAMGAVVGLISMSILLPIYQLMTKVA